MPEASLTIIEPGGWSKSVRLDKAITRIGSAPYNDVRLSIESISPTLLQVLYSPELPTSCRLVNLSDVLTIENQGVQRSVAPFVTEDIRGGDELLVGEYRLAFDLPLTTEQVQVSRSIEASLVFHDTLLRPDYPLEGTLTVKNLGARNGVQFQVALSGLPDDCFQIDPIPLIYSSAQEEVRVQAFHQTTYPAAGYHDIYLTVTASASYPGERLVIQQGIYVAPVFAQSIEIFDEFAAPKEAAAQVVPLHQPQPVEPARAQITPAPVISQPELVQEVVAQPEPVQPEPAQEVVVSSELVQEEPFEPGPVEAEPVLQAEEIAPPAEVIPVAPAPAVPPPPTRPKPNLDQLKVVRHQVDEYWDES